MSKVNFSTCLNPKHSTGCAGTYPDCENLVEDKSYASANNPSEDKWLTDLLDKHGLAYLVTDNFDFIEELDAHYEQRMQEEVRKARNEDYELAKACVLAAPVMISGQRIADLPGGFPAIADRKVGKTDTSNPKDLYANTYVLRDGVLKFLEDRLKSVKKESSDE